MHAAQMHTLTHLVSLAYSGTCQARFRYARGGTLLLLGRSVTPPHTSPIWVHPAICTPASLRAPGNTIRCHSCLSKNMPARTQEAWLALAETGLGKVFDILWFVQICIRNRSSEKLLHRFQLRQPCYLAQTLAGFPYGRQQHITYLPLQTLISSSK
jgi:hypothetical protein